MKQEPPPLSANHWIEAIENLCIEFSLRHTEGQMKSIADKSYFEPLTDANSNIIISGNDSKSSFLALLTSTNFRYPELMTDFSIIVLKSDLFDMQFDQSNLHISPFIYEL